MRWIKREEGMPEIGEFVIWRTELKSYFVRAINKDDAAWYVGEPECQGQSWTPVCTHWARIVGPEDDTEPDQDVLWDEIRNDMTGGVFYSGRPDIVDKWSKAYTLNRK